MTSIINTLSLQYVQSESVSFDFLGNLKLALSEVIFGVYKSISKVSSLGWMLIVISKGAADVRPISIENYDY